MAEVFVDRHCADGCTATAVDVDAAVERVVDAHTNDAHLYRYGLCSYGLYSYGLFRYGLFSYGLYSYGPLIE